MTREQAYEKLELPAGTDLQIVRQKFQQMHNDFQVQIDGAFNEAMRKRKEQQFEELKEAFAVLNESTSMDDSASLPRTEKTFAQTEEEAKKQTAQQQSVAKEEQQAPPPPPSREESQQTQEQAPPVYTMPPAKRKSNTVLFVGIAAGVVVILGIAYFINSRSGAMDNPLVAETDQRQDSVVWQTALVANSEATYQHYLEQYPKGIFAQAARDSLAQINELTDDIVEKSRDDDAIQIEVNTSTEDNNKKSQTTGNTSWRKKYDNVASFEGGLSRVELNGKYGVVDKSGNEVIPVKYDDVWDFSDGLANVKLNGKWGFIDKTGKEVIPLKYDGASLFKHGISIVTLNGKKGFVDRAGNQVLPIDYDDINVQHFMYYVAAKDLIPIKKNNRVGLANTKGEIVVPVSFSYASKTETNLYSIEDINGKIAFFDATGNQLTPFKYDKYMRSGSGGDIAVQRIAVKSNGKWGFINFQAKEVIPIQFDDTHYYSFKSERAMVCLDGEYYYIDKNGKRIED